MDASSPVTGTHLCKNTFFWLHIKQEKKFIFTLIELLFWEGKKMCSFYGLSTKEYVSKFCCPADKNKHHISAQIALPVSLNHPPPLGMP